MSSTQYIKFFNDTVLKQSILQGYEIERTNENFGKFTMGELAFTRDTGRVFVGTYSNNKKQKNTDGIDGITDGVDIADVNGGILVGNRYHGIKTNTNSNKVYIPSYNIINKKYDGDYSFDKDSCSLIIYDKNITSQDNKIFKISGSITIPVYVTDNKTIYSVPENGLNVLKISDDCLNDISPSKITMNEESTCELPSSVKFGEITTNLNIDDKKGDYYNFVYNSTEKTLSLSPTEKQKSIEIEEGDGIKISKNEDNGTYKISWNPPANINNEVNIINDDINDELQDLYTSNINYTSINYLKKPEALSLTNNIIDKNIEELSYIPSKANSLILQITTSKDNITRIRHIKSTGVLLSQIPASSEQQIYTLEVPLIIEQIDGQPLSKKITIHSTGSPSIKVLGYRA